MPMDLVPTVEQLQPDIFVVNEDGASSEKEAICHWMGLRYIVLPCTLPEGLTVLLAPTLKRDIC